MDLRPDQLDSRHRHIVDTCEPFVISYPANYDALDFAPMGFVIPEHRRYTATRLSSRDVIDGLHHLDRVTFGDQEMRMPRWVLFDCGEFPGMVFGFGRAARELPMAVREAYHVVDRDEAFVPLSMWVAIPCAEPDAWFGHNLSSANLVLKVKNALPGLATLTKVLGVGVTQAKRQYGATQWDSSSISLHLRLGPMEVLSAYTPAHTHPETLSYLIQVDDQTLAAAISPRKHSEDLSGDRIIEAGDSQAIRDLHDEIESGIRWQMVRAEKRADGPQRLHLVRLPA